MWASCSPALISFPHTTHPAIGGSGGHRASKVVCHRLLMLQYNRWAVIAEVVIVLKAVNDTIQGSEHGRSGLGPEIDAQVNFAWRLPDFGTLKCSLRR